MYSRTYSLNLVPVRGSNKIDPGTAFFDGFVLWFSPERNGEPVGIGFYERFRFLTPTFPPRSSTPIRMRPPEAFANAQISRPMCDGVLLNSTVNPSPIRMSLFSSFAVIYVGRYAKLLSNKSFKLGHCESKTLDLGLKTLASRNLITHVHISSSRCSKLL